MKKINKSRFAILGMLFDELLTGYEIRKRMLSSTAHFWQESDSSIYPMLKILEAEEKVTSRSEYNGKRARKIFEITSLGKQEFSDWLAAPAEDENRRSEFILKIFFGGHASKKEMLNHLYSECAKNLEEQKRYKNIEASIFSKISEDHEHKPFWMMTLRFGFLHSECELQWLGECIKILEKNKNS